MSHKLHMTPLGFVTHAEQCGMMSGLFALHTIKLDCMTHMCDLKLWPATN